MDAKHIQINLNNGPIDIILQRSRRRKRSIAITIQKDGKIVLKSPHRVAAAELRRFILSKTAWLETRLKKIAANPASAEGIIHLLGQVYEMRVEKSALLRRGGFCELTASTLHNRPAALHVYVPAGLTPKKEKLAAQVVMEIWYKKQAAAVFKARADIYAAQLGVQYQSIKLSDPKSRWGSCDKQGKLMFSWRAVMVPIELIDYLIVHELSHIIHFDHSKSFWKTVEKILPDYKARRIKLRDAERLVHH